MLVQRWSQQVYQLVTSKLTSRHARHQCNDFYPFHKSCQVYNGDKLALLSLRIVIKLVHADFMMRAL